MDLNMAYIHGIKVPKKPTVIASSKNYNNIHMLKIIATVGS